MPYLSVSAVVIHYEEALYQVYAPLPLWHLARKQSESLLTTPEPHGARSPEDNLWGLLVRDYFTGQMPFLSPYSWKVWVCIWLFAVDVLPGNGACDLNYVSCEDGLFGRHDNAGFLYFRPSYQCLQGFTVPETPFLLGILVLQSEVVWAQILPLRLLLRLGSEYRCMWFLLWQILVRYLQLHTEALRWCFRADSTRQICVMCWGRLRWCRSTIR